MKDKKLLYFNRTLAFLAFLCAFGKLCYEWGYNKNHDGFIMLFIFPILYFVILLITHKFIYATFYTKKPYIIIAVIIAVFIALMWTVYLINFFSENASGTFTRLDIYYDCIITVLSISISIVYFLVALKTDKN